MGSISFRYLAVSVPCLDSSCRLHNGPFQHHLYSRVELPFSDKCRKDHVESMQRIPCCFLLVWRVLLPDRGVESKEASITFGPFTPTLASNRRTAPLNFKDRGLPSPDRRFQISKQMAQYLAKSRSRGKNTSSTSDPCDNYVCYLCHMPGLHLC